MADKIFDNMTGARFASQIILQSEQPLDARTVVATKDDLDRLINEHGVYEGIRVYVKEKKEFYRYVDGAWSIDGLSSEDRESISRSIGTAQTAAETAKTAADNAQSTADAANTAAGNAQTTANAAKTAAESAQSAADSAQSSADTAQAAAEAAQTTADNALTEISKTNSNIDNISQISLKRKIIQSLPSATMSYNFEDEKTVFSVPSIGSTIKGISSILVDEETGNHYQYVNSTGASGASNTIGSTANVYSQFQFPESMTNDVKIMTVEFDFQYVANKRMTVALADLDVLNSLGNSKMRYLSTGVAFDIFSTDNTEIRINGSGGRYNTFFGQWLHAKVIIDFTAKTAQYTITQLSDSTVIMSGTKAFRDTTITKVTGFAMYTWQQNDGVYFDNITITSEFVIRENIIYMIPKGDGYASYIYVDEVPHELISASNIMAMQDDTTFGLYKISDLKSGDLYDRIPNGYMFLYIDEKDTLEKDSLLYNDSAGGLYYDLIGGTFSYGYLYLCQVTEKPYHDVDNVINGEITIYSSIKLDMDIKLYTDNLQTYSTTPQRIGTWVDGTPIWRVAFSYEISAMTLPTSIYDDGVITAIINGKETEIPFCFYDDEGAYCCIPYDYFQEIMGIKNFNPVQFILNHRLELGAGCIIDGGIQSLSFKSGSGFIFPFASSPIGGVYPPSPQFMNIMQGWIEFVTPESNIIT